MINWFSRSLQLNGFPLRKAQAFLEQLQGVPEAGYEEFVERKKEEILEYHREHNDFYRGFLGADIRKWEQVPIMSRKDLQRPLRERLSRGYSARRCYVGKTSGSSGQPFVFAKDRFCHALSWAQFFEAYRGLGLDLNQSLQARFYGIPLDRRGYLKEQLKDRLARRYRFPLFRLDEGQMEAYLRIFRKRKFVYLNGYPSPMLFFAKYLQRQGLVLKELCPSLRLCLVTSEMFFPEDRQLLEERFGLPVVSEYGASEFGLLALEDREGQWRIRNETSLVEIVDEQGNSLPPGREGRIVVTSLFNRAHPFIRYDLGDRGVLAHHSSSKRPVLKKLSGRSSELAELPSGKSVPGLTFYYITKRIMERNVQVREFVVRQLSPQRFRIVYVAPEPLPPEQLEEIKRAMAEYLESGLKIGFEHTRFIDRSRRGKLKQFEAVV